MQQNKNLLPPFLMVRSGLLNDYILALLATAVLSMPVILYQAYSPRYATMPAILSLCALAVSCARTHKKKLAMQEDIESLMAHLDGLKSGMDDFSVYGTHFPKMTERIIQYRSKHDPELFYRIIENPGFVQNPKVISDVIAGHLKQNPNDAKLVNAEQIDIRMLPPRLYKKVIRINPKLLSK